MTFVPFSERQGFRVILETDFCGDVDDVGALALLISYCQKTGVELAGVSVNVNRENEAYAVGAVLDSLGAGNVPVAVTDGALPSFGKNSKYVDSLAGMLSEEKKKKLTVLSVPDLYRSVFDKSASGTVGIISVGFLNNIDSIYSADPARFEEKVSSVIMMAGNFAYKPDYREFNVAGFPDAFSHFVMNYRGEEIFCGFGTGVDTMTDLRPYSDVRDNPMTEAYRLYTDGKFLRPSWDPVTVDLAFLGECGYYALSERGKVSSGADSVTHFTPDPDGNARYLTYKLAENEISAHISASIAKAAKLSQ